MQQLDTRTLNELREILVEWFDESDLRNLCFVLGVKYHHLGGNSAADKARELISYMVRHGRFVQLVEASADARPHIESLQVIQRKQSSPNGTNIPIPPLATSLDLPVHSDIIKIELRFIPQSDTTSQIIWESNVIGSRRSTLKLPFSVAMLPVMLKALDAVQYPTYPDYAPQFSAEEKDLLTELGWWQHGRIISEIYSRFGEMLYQALTEDIEGKTALTTARDHAVRMGCSMTYMLRFPTDAVLFAALPWELLRDDYGFLLAGRGKMSSCVRYLDLDQALPPTIPNNTKRRMLVLAPKAGISESVRIEERTARMAALSPIIQEDMFEVEEVSSVTLPALVDWFQTHPPIDFLYFYGHGRYYNGQGELLLDTNDGGQAWVACERVATLLGNVRLVILCACQSAMIGQKGLLTGAASALVAAGVPSVVAMQFSVRIPSATRFAEIVCRNLAQDTDLLLSVARARQSLYIEEQAGVSWWVPTLTVRSHVS